MKILVGFECSQVVTMAMRKKGHEAFSNDLQPGRSTPAYHIQSDFREAARSQIWDIIIMHPPCTELCFAGNGHYARSSKRTQAASFAQECWEIAINQAKAVAMEQPKSYLYRVMGKPTQKIHPWEYGHPEYKETWLWLHNLPRLKPTNIVTPIKDNITSLGQSKERQYIRSKTFQGIANAMAEQWQIKNLPFIQQLSIFED